jgi:RimJ/RimL family protein N-acetyltransferase
MIFKEKQIILKDGRKCLLRSPKPDEAKEMMDYLRTCATETNFILRYPEECTETVEEEERFLKSIFESEYNLMIVAIVDGEIAGNCQLNIHKRMKVRHRGDVAIGIIKKYWNNGLGTAMFQELIDIAKEKACLQLELEFIEGNERAVALYEKMGFRVFGERKRGVILKDGTPLSEFFMVKYLD